MELIPLVLLGANAYLTFVLLRAAIRPRYGAFSGSLVHPYLLLGVLVLLFSLDFLLFTLQDGAVSGRELIPLPERGGDRAFALFTLLNIIGVSGLMLGERWAAESPDSAQRVARSVTDGMVSSRSASIIGVGLLVVLGLVIVTTLHRAVGLGNILTYTRLRFVYLHESRVLQYAYGLVPPAVALILTASQPRQGWTWVVLAVAALLLLISGTRGHLVFLALIVLVWLIVHGTRVPARVALLLVPLALVALMTMRFLLRDIPAGRSWEQILENIGGWMGLVMNLGDVASTDNLTLLTEGYVRLPREPLQSVGGLLVYPLPREIVGFKPYSASIEFTIAQSPWLWHTTRTSTNLGGYGDLFAAWRWGTLGIVFLLGFVYSRFFWILGTASAPRQVFWVPVLLYVLFHFMKTGIMELGYFVWPFLFVGVTHALVERFERGDGARGIKAQNGALEQAG
jgi:hypothetical protein